VKIPTAAIVENMSFFVCDGCGKRHEIFQGSSEAGSKRLQKMKVNRFIGD
jgi:ATP-binding protein involved in chromosome partitioning